MIESDAYEPKPLTVETMCDAVQHAADNSVAPSHYPVQVPQEVYDRLVAAGATEGFEPIQAASVGAPNMDVITARCAVLTNTPLSADLAMRLGLV